MKLIPLTQGKFAMVDDEDFEWLNQWKWCVESANNGNTYYAQRKVWNGYGIKETTISMHRLIMGYNPLRLCVDHIDGDGSNNQKYNLRFCTVAQNIMNSGKHKIKSSIHKGVSWDIFNKKWRAKINIGRQQLYTKRFNTETEAALQYDTWAKELFGEFARLNFPENKPTK